MNWIKRVITKHKMNRLKQDENLIKIDCVGCKGRFYITPIGSTHLYCPFCGVKGTLVISIIPEGEIICGMEKKL